MIAKGSQGLADLLAHLAEMELMAKAVSVAETYHRDCATRIEETA